MTKKRLISSSRLGAALIASFLAQRAEALETQTFDAHCRVEGLSRPLRQTVVIIDQAAIEPRADGDVGENNRRWINKIIAIAGVQEGQTSSASAPRERISVVVAREDGTDLIRVFSGCSPTYSQSEITELKKASSGMASRFKWFFGKDVEHQLEADRKAFRSKLTGGLADLPKTGASRKASDPVEQGGFLQTLSLLSGTFDLNEGVPRLIIISPMKFSSLRSIDNVKSARSLGFDTAEKLGADLQRAEVYVTNLASDANRYVRDFCAAFFLGIKGKFVAGSGETLPAFLDAPEKLRVFSGFIDYGGVQVPMQLRYATDRSGSLVNSWAEVAVKRPVATPLSGKAVCKDETENCEVKGDGKEFAQVWAAETGSDPKFSESMPFSGVRYFEFTTTRTGLTGRVYDPLVIINGKKELTFQLTPTPNVRF